MKLICETKRRGEHKLTSVCIMLLICGASFVSCTKNALISSEEASLDEDKQVQSVWLCSGVRRAVLKSGECVDFDVQSANLRVQGDRLVGVAKNGSSIDISIEKISHVQIQNDAIIMFDKNKGRLSDDKNKIVGITKDGKRVEIFRSEVLYVKTKVANKTMSFVLGGFATLWVYGIIEVAKYGWAGS